MKERAREREQHFEPAQGPLPSGIQSFACSQKISTECRGHVHDEEENKGRGLVPRQSVLGPIFWPLSLAQQHPEAGQIRQSSAEQSRRSGSGLTDHHHWIIASPPFATPLSRLCTRQADSRLARPLSTQFTATEIPTKRTLIPVDR